MKVPASIRRLHDDQAATNDRLKKVVDERIIGLKNRRWHYESRVKALPSFALKVESGRFRNPAALEDFFACTIVVSSSAEIGEAEELIRGRFEVKERRPKQPHLTHKSPDAFPFDDLRLYCTLSNNPALPPSDLGEIVFEAQVKTFLQHAWSIATHDLMYKSDDANWGTERIAYQIKAMLEHAEVSIQEAEILARTPALKKEDERTATIRNGIALLKSQWPKDELPTDVRRLATNIDAVTRELRVSIERLREILDEGKARNGGSHPSNLSPHCTVIQYLFDAEREKMTAFLRDARKKTKVLIPAEISLPDGLDRDGLVNAIFVG